MNTAQAFTDWFAPTYGREYGAPIMEGDPVFIVAGRYLALGFTPAVGKPSPEAAEERAAALAGKSRTVSAKREKNI